MATYARKLTQLKRPDVEIFIDDHTDERIYTTFDAVNGRAEITAPHSARFDDIQITFEGCTRTYVDNMSPASTKSRTTALHKFLKLVMPIQESEYPQPRIAEAGRTYSFPFNFVIPDQLLPSSCSHKHQEDHVQHAHLQLPPSMGDREVSIKDDLTPGMAKVQYAIKVQVIKYRESDGKKMTLTEGLRKLYIIPAVLEAPPMSISMDDQGYTLSKSKSLKKGVFSGKLGKITVSAAQTTAFVLPSSFSGNSVSTTMATVNLRFDPHGGSSQPPRLGGLTSKLKAFTFFAVRPIQALASLSMMTADYDLTRGVYKSTVPLSSRCVENVSWVKHVPKTVYDRRGSDSSSSSSDLSDSPLVPQELETMVFYTAAVVVPIALPSTKAWTPTFHSCITSRIYALDLSLSIHTPGTGVPASTVSLRLPVQIAALGNRDAPAPLSPLEAAAELAQADEFLRPRVIEIPNAELVGNSVLHHDASELPPSYEDFAELVLQQTVTSRC